MILNQILTGKFYNSRKGEVYLQYTKLVYSESLDDIEGKINYAISTESEKSNAKLLDIKFDTAFQSGFFASNKMTFTALLIFKK